MVTNRIIDGIAHVFIDGEIGTKILGSSISREILDFKAQGFHVVVNINSAGGSVFDGYQIIDAMLKVGADTHVSGMAASIAGIIALFGRNVTANDFSILMVHAPSGGDKGLVELVRGRLKKILLDKTSFSEGKIEDMLSKQKGSFFDADEAYQMGLLTESPINTGKKRIENQELVNLSSKQQYEVFNKLTVDSKMTEVTNKLQLKDDATEKDIVNKIEGLQNEAKDAIDMATKAEADKLAVEKENKELNEKIENLEKTTKETAQKAASMLVNNAVENGKIKKEDSKEWQEMAVENYDQAEKLIGSIVIDHSNRAVDVGNNGNASNEDLTKNPEKLKAFMRNEAEVKNLIETDVKKFEKYQEAYINLN